MLRLPLSSGQRSQVGPLGFKWVRIVNCPMLVNNLLHALGEPRSLGFGRVGRASVEALTLAVYANRQ